ncbi:DUF397 domain-containing protein [Paractinoplanes atraurantiacus]|uniref:DUF397 domain-containing protein n=1 Tax=Paractinoplanes atraurantiacus TaxID=1036182 RepID=A0A285ISY9_9ACTN|nr:DUF397 domain-containing protein [Actinoplanes atraurantiacus]SNY50061.1 protein of unknown function [Actinoplanes atraurantiacus]
MTDRRELNWRTSSRSGGGDCVEVALEEETGLVHMRDSKDRSGPVLTFDRETFRAFIAFVAETGANDLTARG